MPVNGNSARYHSRIHLITWAAHLFPGPEQQITQAHQARENVEPVQSAKQEEEPRMGIVRELDTRP